MKKKMISKSRITKVKIPGGRLQSDWFTCSKCGYSVMIKTLYNQIECSECGGTMYRE